MASKQRVRPRIGDVIRIIDRDGRAADAQYTHKEPMHGALLRVLGPAALGDDASDAARVAARPTQFLAFFPLGAACAQGIATILGPAPVPAHAQPFPVFRAGRHRVDGQPGYHEEGWWLWDGAREWPVGRLTPDLRALPLREVLNDTLLVERAHAGWRAEEEG